MGDEEKTFGVSEIKKVVALPVEIGNVIPQVAAATSIIGKVRALGSLTDELMDLATLDVPLLGKQWADFTPEERTLVGNWMKDEYDIADDQVEALVELGFDLAVRQVTLGADMVTFAKAVMAAKK